jgi:hypothetical protein
MVFQKGDKMRLGMTFTDETKRQMSESHKRVWHDADHRARYAEGFRKRSENPVFIEKLRQEGYRRFRGRKLSAEHKLRISIALIGKAKSDLHKKRLSESHIGVNVGKFNGRWCGGTSFEPYPPFFNMTLRRLVRERFSNLCMVCGIGPNGTLHRVHHINYDKNNNDLNNLIPLCNSCHLRTNFRRDYWVRFFIEMLHDLIGGDVEVGMTFKLENGFPLVEKVVG